MEFETLFNEYIKHDCMFNKAYGYSDLWTEYHDCGHDNGWSETNPW